MAAAKRTHRMLQKLLALATPQQLYRLKCSIKAAEETLRALPNPAPAEPLVELLRYVDRMVPTASELKIPSSDADHDYHQFLKLCRSVKFSWGPMTSRHDAEAFTPNLWAIHDILRNSDREEAWRVLEIGAGTGALGYELSSARPRFQISQADPALESLVFAALIQGGESLRLPMRVSFDADPSGIGWFDVAVAPLSAEIDLLPLAMPDLSELDAIVAVNSLSLAPDPRMMVRELCRRVRSGGLFIWLDLLSWRVETPSARQLRGSAEMSDLVTSCGFQVIRRIAGIPYVEDWGFERRYTWTSHAIVARRKGNECA